MKLTLETLNNTGDELFEKIIKSLLIHVIGPGVTPFTKGKDGAREAIFSGKAPYPSLTNQWSGEWIFQVKFSDISKGLADARKSVTYLIDQELKKLERYDYIKENKCDNYIYIINVPFSGTAKTGLHDYIKKKSKTYKVKNFDYWDGEKILGLLAHYPTLSQSYFPIRGFSELAESEIKLKERLFVKPIQYETLKANLLKDKLINIVGPAHVGKTSLSIFLANEVFVEKSLNKIWLVPLVDKLDELPDIENCVIIFDDLYGEFGYEPIGRDTKIITHLLKKNYVVITSRDYIFSQAIKQMENIDTNSQVELMLQEGSYSSEMLFLIFKNHLDLKLERKQLSDITYNYILSFQSLIIHTLRFPHNLQVFVDICDNKIRNKKQIEQLIKIAKKIEAVIIKFVGTLDDSTQKNLLIAAFGRLESLKQVTELCMNCWGVKADRVRLDFKKCNNIVSIDGDKIKFLHPSYKSAVLDFFKQDDPKLINETILRFIFDSPKKLTKAIHSGLVREAINDLKIEQIEKELLSRLPSANLLTKIWFVLLKRDYVEATDMLLRIMQNAKNKDKLSRFSMTFLSAKFFLSEQDVMNVIMYILPMRGRDNKLVNHLITDLCHKFLNKSKIYPIINLLDRSDQEDEILKVELLGVVGTTAPKLAFNEIIAFCSHENKLIRMAAYSALVNLPASYAEKINSLLQRFAGAETNYHGTQKLKRLIANRPSISIIVK